MEQAVKSEVTKDPSIRPHRRKRLGDATVAAGLLALSLLLAFGLGEVLLRLINFSYPSFYAPDDVLGFGLRPGAEGWNRGEADLFVRINSQGLRDGEHTFQKDKNVYRIAVLGDSYAEAMQVDIENTFWSLLAEEVSRCGFVEGKRVEAINFGVSGYGTAQQLLILRDRVWRYDPDLVLLAFFPGNDVRNNSKALEMQRLRPFFVLADDGNLHLDDSFRTSAGHLEHKHRMARSELLHGLRLYHLWRMLRVGPVSVRHNAPIAVALADGDHTIPSLNEPGLDEHVLRPPLDAVWQEAWIITEKLIQTVHKEVSARDKRFLLAVLSMPAIAHPDSHLRKRYAEYLGITELFYPDRRLQQICTRAGNGCCAARPQDAAPCG